MPTSLNSEPTKGLREQHRVQMALYRRCRRGLPDALRALLYRNGDRWYTAALMISSDEAAAAEVMVAAWRSLLGHLCRLRFGGAVERRGWALVRATLAEDAGRREASRAVAVAANLAPDTAVAMPAELTTRLLAVADELAPRITAAFEARNRVTTTLRGGLGLVAVAALTVAVWLLLMAGQAADSGVIWRCVRERVIAADMAGIIADAHSEFAIFEEQGQASEAVLQQAGLILEEIANAPQAASPLVMGYLGDRSRAERLAEGMAELGERYSGAFGQDLLSVALILEEVEAW